MSGASNPYRQLTLDLAGRPVYALDENGARTNYTHVAGGHLSQVVQNALGAAADQLTTQYWYNSRDQLEWIRKPKGTETEERWIHFDYFERTLANPNNHTGKYLGKLTQISTQTGPAVGGVTPYSREHFGYDAAGRLAWNRKPDGAVIQYFYDEQHRPSRIDYPDNPATSHDSASSVEYEYDPFGRMFRMRDTAGGVPNSTTYSFDGLGRVSGVTHSSLRNGLTYEYVRDLVNKRWVTKVNMGGLTWEYRLDPKGRLSGVVNPFGQATSFQYDLEGKVLRQDNGNGTWSTYGYDPAFPTRDWLSSIEHWKTPGSPQKIAGFTYSRSDGGTTDLTGRIRKETDHLGQVHSFVYNALGRLVEEKDPAFGTRKYTYDSHGNLTWRRTTQGGTNEDRYFGYDWLDRLVWGNNSNSAPGGSPSGYYQKWTYDLAGRPTRRERRLGGTANPKQVHDFHWDSQDKMRAVFSSVNGSASSLQWSATYDGGGIRASQTDTTGTRVFHTDGDSLLQETGGTAPSVTHTPGLGQRSGTTDRTFHQDWLGSSRYLTDNAGATQSAGAWSAYGKRAGSSGSVNDTRMRWGGGWGYQSDTEGASNETELVLMGQRYYDPEVARFISPDPSGFSDGLNLYSYVGGDPVSFVDPLGLWKTGSYLGDVGEVFKGYGDTLNPVNWYNGAKGLWNTGRQCGAGAAAKAFGQGLVHSFTDWATTDDPRAFGRSFGTVLTTAAPGIKGIPMPRGLRNGIRAKLPHWISAPTRINSGRVLWRAREAADSYHNFPESFDAVIFKGKRTVVEPDYILYTKRGSINGKNGTFELGVRPEAGGRIEVITHRFFRADRRAKK